MQSQRLAQYSQAVAQHQQGQGGPTSQLGGSRQQPFSQQGGGTATMVGRVSSVAWAQIQQPGVWVDASTGDLVRIPPSAFANGLGAQIPLIEIETNRLSARFYFLSPNPFIETTEARQLIEQLQMALAQQSMSGGGF